MSETLTATNGTKATSKDQTDSTKTTKQPKKEKKLTSAMSGASIQSGTIPYRYCTTAVAWKDLKVSDTFSRSSDGKVVYMKTSRSMAHPLDKGVDPMPVPSDAQNLEVYRVFLTTF